MYIPSLHKFANYLKYHIKNIPGWRTNRKIVVFESDDWGSNRIASRNNYESLLQRGIKLDNNAYNKYDTIERKEDLEALFEVLTSVKDKHGKYAVFTPFVNTANPDFKKIKDSGFSEYYYESFYRTLERYGQRTEVSRLYKEGIKSGIFIPQYHGREHLAVTLWMEYLKKGQEKVRKAFEEKFYSVPLSDLNRECSSFRPTFYYVSNSDLDFLKSSLHEGADLFEKFFGYRPTVFVPPNGIFPESLQIETYKIGIKSMVVSRIRDVPVGNGKMKKKYHTFGQKNQFNQVYYIRTCAFEPYADRGIEYCMPMIEAAFRCHKPAIISTHRVNYNGGIDPKNRQKGLNKLQNLLKAMIKKWPEIEFMSSKELFLLIQQSKNIDKR